MPAAAYFDGQSARRREVVLSFSGGLLQVDGDGIARREPLAGLHISERLGSTPRLIRFADGAYCEVRDHSALDAVLAAAGHRGGLVERWQQSWHVALVAALLTAAVAAAAYRWGVPVAVQIVAARLPDAVSRRLSDSTLATLDRYWLEPSKLDAQRQAALAAGFAALKPPAGEENAPEIAPQIVFRSSPKIGPNAFALPDGRVILLDQLVALAGNDAEIYGVLAHERGHVHYRHGLRQILQGSVVALAMTAWFGDVSTLLATVPTALLQLRYSREFEAQADDYAVRMLLANGIAPAHLADLLERLVARHGGDKDSGGLESYLSSHPAPAERISRLRAAQPASR